MSGQKETYVRLRRSEYNRVMSTCRRVDNIDGNVRATMQREAANLRRDLESRVAGINRRHDNLEKGLSQMGDAMRKAEAEQTRRMKEQAKQFQRGLDGLGKEMKSQRKEYRRLIKEQAQRFDKAMAQQRKDLERQIGDVRDAIAKKAADEAAQARQWIDDTRVFLDLIDRETRHEKFSPGDMEKLRGEFAMAEGNFNQETYQAAIAAAQQTYRRASELRMKVAQLEMQWEAALDTARQSAAEALATLDAQTTARLTFEGGEEEVPCEVDFWTEGGISALREEVAAEQKRLGAPEDLSLEDLKDSVARSEAWRDRSLELAETARERLMASQLRNNIAQAIHAALAGAGWDIADAAFEGQDFRGALHLKLRNFPGDEIVTIITPKEGERGEMENNLLVSFFDHNTNDEDLRKEQRDEIVRRLKAQGLEVGDPVCRPGTENQPARDAVLLDFDRVRAPKQAAAGA